VIAGVVGLKKFAFDVWGDTVNTASRLETASAPGKINMSAEFRRQLPAEAVLRSGRRDFCEEQRRAGDIFSECDLML